jgi:glycosyltransferase involved in cell wall biosynthesis
MRISDAFRFLNQKVNYPSQNNYDYIFNQGKSRRKILILVENINATYYLSFHYVLQRFYERNEINFFVISSQTINKRCGEYNNNPSQLIKKILSETQPNFVIFSRYGLPYGKIFQQECQEKKIPTIYHIDDDLLNIPSSLGEGIQKQHGNKAVLAEREYLLENVDLIYTSTPYLAETLNKRFPHQKFYYGIYAPYLDFLLSKNNDSVDIQKDKDCLIIGYMGSKGHQEDIKMVAPAIAQILADYPHIRFETFGTIVMPNEVTKFTERITSHKVNSNYEEFLQKLYNLQWDIGLAPLQNNIFNNCKAPTKYIEYTSSNIPTIASHLGVYNQFIDSQEIILAKPEEWYDKIKLLIKNSNLRQSLTQQAKARCSKDFSMEILDKQINTLLS